MDLVRAYIQYLRDVSRRIAHNVGFENVLPSETRKKKNYYYSLDNYPQLTNLFFEDEHHVPASEKQFIEYLKRTDDFLRKREDYKLFIGLGIIHGEHNDSKICAPLVTVIANIDYEDNSFIVSIDEQSFQINYDLLAKFLNIKIDEENDEFVLSVEDQEKFNIVEEIENEILNAAQNRTIPNISVLFAKIQKKILSLNDIHINTDSFEYENRFRNSLGATYFTPHYFCFTRPIPNSLSTYEALNDLLRQKPINNPLLEALLSNSINNDNSPFPISEPINDESINNAIESIFLELSQKQREAIRKAWKNPISYVEGPPGTGKSYTIIALMLSALALNKTVLFVSHKKPALRVVKERIDKLLGEHSLLYITTRDEKSGAHDKEATREYLNRILLDSDELTKNILNKRQKEFEDDKRKYDRINDETHSLKSSIEYDLELSNQFYKANKNFIDERDFFVKDLDIPLSQYQFRTKHYNENKYNKLFKKLAIIYNSSVRSRLTELFKVKGINHFIREFGADKIRLTNNYRYFENIFKLNNYYSKSLDIKNKIVNERLDTNRRRLIKSEKEKIYLLQELIPKTLRFQILSKIFNHQAIKDSIQSYRASLYWKAPKQISKSWENVNFKALTETFPLWCSELRTLGSVFPMLDQTFDLVIVDEASQVNIAEIIPAFYRGKRFCIVGDDKQLHLNATGVGFSLSKSFDNLCWVKNDLHKKIPLEEAKKKNLFVSDASVLKFVNSELRSQAIPETQLDEHYRSLPPLAKFNSENFYQDNWKIMTENGENRFVRCFKAIKVNGSRDAKQKYVKAEIDELIAQLKSIIDNNGFLNHPDIKSFNFSIENKPTIGIITILRDQATRISEMLEESGISDKKKEFDIMVGTPEEFQGNERDIMFFTFGLDGTNKWGKGHYENPNRFNVATSRAKYFTCVIYAGIPKDANLIKKYLHHFDVKINNDDLIDLKEMQVVSPSPENGWRYKPENRESEFEIKVDNYLLSQFVSTNNSIELFNQVTACGQKRLDFVLYNRDKKITCVVEVDGPDHFIGNSINYTEAHLERIAILKRAGWKIINIKYHNWYSNGWLCDKKNPNPIFEEEIATLNKNLREALELD